MINKNRYEITPRVRADSTVDICEVKETKPIA